MSEPDRAPSGHLRIGGWLPRPRALPRRGGAPTTIAHAAGAVDAAAAAEVDAAEVARAAAATPATADPASAARPTDARLADGAPFPPDLVPRLDLDDDTAPWADDDAFDRPPVWYRRTPYAILASFLVVIVVVVAAVRLLGTPGAPETDDRGLARVPTRQFIPAPEPPGLESRSTAPGSDAASSAPPGGAASTAGQSGSPGTRPGGSAAGQPTGGTGPGNGPGPTNPPPASPPPAAAVSYEAEASGNVMSGSAWAHTVTGASGGKVVSVGWIGGMLRFTGIAANAGGKYTVTIDYLCDQQRTAQLRVNGGSESTVTFASSGGTTRVAALTVTVTLKAGANTLEFSNPGGWTPDFDRITVR